ncbi:hypothetical protein [Hungatella sp.]|uniref:hypothetical protein n=1 Tax=Hungatella sp. TaxID=2613924 RepID=UPI002A8096D0|nr:hypothetical protein [Hungatella sp.]
MQSFLHNIFFALTERETWITGLQVREPVVYIAAGIFGILLFCGFVAALVAIGFTAKKQSQSHEERHLRYYDVARNEAAKAVINSLRSQNIPENEIRDILLKEYSFDKLAADALMALK